MLSCHTKDEIPDLSALLNLPCTMNVDWERRLDHMQQHTAQHGEAGWSEARSGRARSKRARERVLLE